MAVEKLASIDVTVRIDKAHAARMDEIVRSLKARGLGSVEAHVRFMIVNGRVNPARIDDLKAIEGVAGVRADRRYRAQDS